MSRAPPPRAALVALLWAVASLASVGVPPAHSQPPQTTPSPPSPPPSLDVCVGFPASVLGGPEWTSLPSFVPDEWVGGILAQADRERLAALLQRQLDFLPPNATRDYDAAMGELAAATLRNLRADLSAEERSRRQQSAFRVAVQRLRTPLAAPRGADFPDYRLPLEKVATVTWLLAYADARTRRDPGEDHLLAMIEPLSWVTGMSLVHAVERFTDRSPRPGPWDPDLRFAAEVLRYPDGPGTELLVTRSLAYSLDVLRGTAAAATPLYRELDRAVAAYFARVEQPAASVGAFASRRDPADVRRLLANRLFLERRRGRSRAPDLVADC